MWQDLVYFIFFASIIVAVNALSNVGMILRRDKQRSWRKTWQLGMYAVGSVLAGLFAGSLLFVLMACLNQWFCPWEAVDERVVVWGIALCGTGWIAGSTFQDNVRAMSAGASPA